MPEVDEVQRLQWKIAEIVEKSDRVLKRFGHKTELREMMLSANEKAGDLHLLVLSIPPGDLATLNRMRAEIEETSHRITLKLDEIIAKLEALYHVN